MVRFCLRRSIITVVKALLNSTKVHRTEFILISISGNANGCTNGTTLLICGTPRAGIHFLLGLCKGRLPFYIIQEGNSYPLGSLCDCFPFITQLRGWMERAITPTYIDRRRNEGTTIECDDGVIEFLLSPTNLESSTATTRSGGYCVVGILKINHVNNHPATHECFCDVERTVYNLNCALQHTFRRYGSTFDDRTDWNSFGRKRLISLVAFFANNTSSPTFDEKCQNATISLQYDISRIKNHILSR